MKLFKSIINNNDVKFSKLTTNGRYDNGSMKLFELTTNNGSYGGCRSHYVIAKNKEDAIAKDEYFQSCMNEKGTDCWITELTGEKLLRALFIKDRDKYDVKLEIMRKSEVGGI